jgi:hypothetical protein
MNYDRILSTILMDAKLGLIAASFFLAIGILIAASILVENLVRNLQGQWRERQARMAAHAGNKSRVLEFVSSPQPTGTTLHHPIAHA